MIISVASGKGGTGKTTVAVSLALSQKVPVTLLDCDVEEPNAALFLQLVDRSERAVTVPVPVIDESKCIACGECARFCEFNAIVHIGTSVMAFHELCHSCGGCALVCPTQAISEVQSPIGTLLTARVANRPEKRSITFAQGTLEVGKALSPPVIREVRSLAAPDGLTIIDCPPGTSCPMFTAVSGTDYVVLVTEPTPFGLHDLRLAVETVRKMGIPCGVIINRSTNGDGRVQKYCAKQGIPVLMEIPEDRKIAEGYSRGLPLVECASEYRSDFAQLPERITRSMP